MKAQKLCFVALLWTLFSPLAVFAQSSDITFFFPPSWKRKARRAKAITDSLTKKTGILIRPRIVKSYPQILAAFSAKKPALVYVGSFAQAVLHARGLSTIIMQGSDGKEFYSGVLIAPKAAGSDAKAIVTAAGADISYCKGASSGESAAKAATGGLASLGTNNHRASVNAVKFGRVKCAFVKNWWWEGNKEKFKGMQVMAYPGVSVKMHPDFVLSANKAVSAAGISKIQTAVLHSKEEFGVSFFKEFDAALLDPTLTLMKMGKIDPKTYSW